MFLLNSDADDSHFDESFVRPVCIDQSGAISSTASMNRATIHTRHEDGAIHCSVCRCPLNEPFISCAQCSSPEHRSCLKCFSCGAETQTHANTHPYVITHDNVKVFPNSNWSAREERHLLELIQQRGFANWDDIALGMTMKSATECRDHYMEYYFDGIFMKTCGLTKHPYAPLRVPYLYKTNTIEPPRHNLDMIHSKYMGGYRFSRSDFDTPYDVSAESLVSHLELAPEWGEDYEDVGNELNAAVFTAFNNRLR